MPLGTNHVTTNTAATFIPEVWSDETVASYKANLVLANLVKNVSFRGRKGDTLHIPSPTRGTASQKSANSQVTLQAATEGEVVVNIDQHWEYSRLIEDITAVQALASLRAFYTDDAGYALAKRVDTSLHNLYSGFQSSTPVIGSDGSTAWDSTANTNTGNGATITDAGIRRMIQTLDDSDVPMSNRYLVIPPVEKSQLLSINRFTEQAFVGEVGSNNSIRTGRLGNIYGVEVYVSTNCPTVTASDNSTQYRVGMLLHRDAMVLAMQLGIRTQAQYKQEYLGWLYTADTIYGVKELRDYAAVAYVGSQV